MDLETIVPGIIFLGICIVLFLYVQHKQKSKKAKLLEDFANLAGQQQLNIAQYDFWDPFYAIGIDAAKNVLFYARKEAGKEQYSIIELSDVAQCRVINKNREANNGLVIERIELAFTSRDSKRAEKLLEFYDRDANLILNEELFLAKKWKDIISSNLSANTPTGQKKLLMLP